MCTGKGNHFFSFFKDILHLTFHNTVPCRKLRILNLNACTHIHTLLCVERHSRTRGNRGNVGEKNVSLSCGLSFFSHALPLAFSVSPQLRAGLPGLQLQDIAALTRCPLRRPELGPNHRHHNRQPEDTQATVTGGNAARAQSALLHTHT